jgi:hypothetical protein
VCGDLFHILTRFYGIIGKKRVGYQKKNQAMISEQLGTMDTLAYQYSNHINDINKQYIIISYEEKELVT